MLHPRGAHGGDEADRVVGELAITPVGDRRLDEGLVGVGGGRLELGALDHDAGVRLPHHVQEHVRVLVLGRLERSPLGSVLAETWNGSDCRRNRRGGGCSQKTLDRSR